jgi:hypothetical protein
MLLIPDTIATSITCYLNKKSLVIIGKDDEKIAAIKVTPAQYKALLAVGFDVV